MENRQASMSREGFTTPVVYFDCLAPVMLDLYKIGAPALRIHAVSTQRRHIKHVAIAAFLAGNWPEAGIKDVLRTSTKVIGDARAAQAAMDEGREVAWRAHEVWRERLAKAGN
jgi:hypothetical protein